nr:short integuments 2, mitochondrial [Quercus suber]
MAERLLREVISREPTLLVLVVGVPNVDKSALFNSIHQIAPSRFPVLLESGALFLFDLESCFRRSRTSNYNAGFRGTKLPVSWDAEADSGNCKWLSCEFSWHPRILIVARSDAVFLVDLRFDGCAVSCLAKVEVLRMYTSVQNERFLMFTMARGSDGFCFSLASDSLLVLCDVQKPMMPLLQWTHGLDNPCDINNCEFNLFCYGPTLPTLRGSIISEVLKTHYAWELPSDLLLSGRECQCGSCLVREEILKDDLPEWIDWQHKKELALGFAILNKDLSAMLSELNEFGGFTLIRLISLNHKASVPCGS